MDTLLISISQLKLSLDPEIKINAYRNLTECIFNDVDRNSLLDITNFISDDLTSTNYKVKSTALSFWEYFFKYFRNDEKYSKYTKMFSMEYFNEDLQYNLDVMKLIFKFNCSEDSLFEHIFNDLDKPKLVNALKANSRVIPPNVCFKFVHYRMIPYIFANVASTDGKCDDLIDYIMSTPLGFAQEFMSAEIMQSFKRSIKNSYMPSLSAAQESSENSVQWWKYCKLLIHYCGRMLHNEIDVTNLILRQVEQGFKTRTSSDRIGSYDCWKVLIENYSLDPNHMKRKQIRLLLKPLKANIAKVPEVTLKRFEAYACFIEKLQKESINCIDDFLIFCFGPFNNDFVLNSTDTSLRNIKAVHPKTTEILLKLIGHDKTTCECNNKHYYMTNIFSIAPIITSENLHNHAELFVNSIRICTEVTRLWSIETHGEMVINCLWSRLFKLLNEMAPENQLEVTKIICRNISMCIKKCLVDEQYYNKILKHILKDAAIFISDIKTYNKVFDEEFIRPIVQNLLEIERVKPNTLSAIITFECVKDFLNFLKLNPDWMKQVKLFFYNFPKNSSLATSLLTNTIKHVASINKIVLDDFKELVIELMACSASNNAVETILSWEYAFDDNKEMQLIKFHLLKKLKSILQNDPSCAFFVSKMCVSFLIISNNDQKFFSELVLLLLMSVSLPLTNKFNSSDYILLINKFVNFNQRWEFNEDGNLLKLYEAALKVHQLNEVLSSLENYISKMKSPQKRIIPKTLFQLIEDLAIDENPEVSKRALNIMTKLDSSLAKTIPAVNPARSVKINDISKNKPSPNSSKTNVIRLFGHDVDNVTPTKIRSSMIDTKIKTSTPKAVNAMPLFQKKHEDIYSLKDDDFTAIKKDVKVNVERLNEHQMEMLKKKRDDIPALYQDLTQSVSNTFDGLGEKMKENISNTENSPNSPKKTNDKVAEDSKPIAMEQTLVKRRSARNSICQTSNVSPSPEKQKPIELREKIENGATEVEFTHVTTSPTKTKLDVITNQSPDKMEQSDVGDKLTSNESKEEKSRRRSRALECLKMDIVGAESYVQNLPRKRIVKRMLLPGELSPERKKKYDFQNKIKTNDASETSKTVLPKNINEDATTSKKRGRPPKKEKTESEQPKGNTKETSPAEKNHITNLSSVRVSLFKETQLPDTETVDIMETENGVCDLETESLSNISLHLETSDGTDNSLISSPVTKDTPTRNYKLVLDTMQISPIKKDCKAIKHTNFEEDEELVETNDKQEEILTQKEVPKPMDTCSPDIFTHKEKEYEIVKMAEENEIPALKAPSSRSAKLLKMLPQPLTQSQLPSKSHKTVIESHKTSVISSPTADRTRKMLKNCEEDRVNVEEEIEEVIEEEDLDILTFSREVPNPLAVPRISILKRKCPDTSDDNFSPCAKRKRVNFSDPPISSKKMYFRDDGELAQMQMLKKKSLNSSLNIKQKVESDEYESLQNGDLDCFPLPSSPPKSDERHPDRQIINILENVIIKNSNQVEIIDVSEENNKEEMSTNQNEHNDYQGVADIIQEPEENENTEEIVKMRIVEDVYRTLVASLTSKQYSKFVFKTLQDYKHLITEEDEKKKIKNFVHNTF